MRDQSYYQRLRQIREKYGYGDENNLEVLPKTSYQINGKNKQASFHQKSVSGYTDKTNNQYMGQSLSGYNRKSILTHNQNIQNIDLNHGKKNGYNFQYHDKLNPCYQMKGPSVEKRQHYDYEKASCPVEQPRKVSNYQRTYLKNEPLLKKQSLNSIYFNDEANLQSSPIKKLSGQLYKKPYNPQFEFRNEPKLNRNQVTPDFYQTFNTITQIRPRRDHQSYFYKEKSPIKNSNSSYAQNYRKIGQKISDYPMSFDSSSIQKGSSVMLTKTQGLSVKEFQNNDDISDKISKIDKIQSKIQSVLNKNK